MSVCFLTLRAVLVQRVGPNIVTHQAIGMIPLELCLHSLFEVVEALLGQFPISLFGLCFYLLRACTLLRVEDLAVSLIARIFSQEIQGREGVARIHREDGGTLLREADLRGHFAF